MRLSHVGHLVRDIEEALALYAGFFDMHPSLVVDLPRAGARNAMLPIGDSFIDLLQPLGKEGPLAEALETRGEGFYHLCLAVDDLEAEARAMRAKGARVFAGPQEPQVMFVHPGDAMGVLFELRAERELKSFLGGGKAPPKSAVVEGLSHVGHAVKDLGRAVEMYDSLFGLKALPSEPRAFPVLGVRSAWVPIRRNFIELFQPTDPAKAVGRFIARQGEGVYAIVFLVKDVDAQVARLRSRGAQVLESPTPPELPHKRAFILRGCMKGMLIGIMTAETVAFESGVPFPA
ncbi:MAG: VOC family protein [Dehalococcoidia bacterium]|nr:VOC family protein [Dehalococcoidia bacterium]